MKSEQELRLIRAKEYAEAKHSPYDDSLMNEIALMNFDEQSKPELVRDFERQFKELNSLAIRDFVNFYGHVRIDRDFSKVNLLQLQGLMRGYTERIERLGETAIQYDMACLPSCQAEGIRLEDTLDNPDFCQAMHIYAGIMNKLEKAIKAKEGKIK